MTLLELQTRTLQRLDEDTSGGGYFTGAEVKAALNEAQRLFALLTLCLETTGTQALDAATPTYHMLTVFPDWFLPLRVRVHGTGGLKLAPSTLADFDALNPAWQNEAGTPERYSHLGFDFVALHKRPTLAGTSLDWTYVKTPIRLVSESASPEIPDENHLDLIDYAIPTLRAKEGGAAFLSSLHYFDRYLESVKKKADFVRDRNQAQHYDRVPLELTPFRRRQIRTKMQLPKGTS